MHKFPQKMQDNAQKEVEASSSSSSSLDQQKPSTSQNANASPSPTPSTTITHRTNKVSSLITNRRPQSMLSARALMFDEPTLTQSLYDRDSLKLSTSPKQQQHVRNFI